MAEVAPSFPRFRPVGSEAVLVEFGETIDAAIHARVLALDTALAAAPFAGFREAVPAYAGLLVVFDPLVTDHAVAGAGLTRLIAAGTAASGAATVREVEVCYDADLAPDLAAVSEACGLTPQEVVAAHLSGAYSVYMFGFAPGYAYLAGVPDAIRLPRKPAPVRDVPAGSVIIAGAQCIVTTITMPTGWWIIGRSPTRILDVGSRERPFLFDVGDSVRFQRIDRAAYDAKAAP